MPSVCFICCFKPISSHSCSNNPSIQLERLAEIEFPSFRIFRDLFRRPAEEDTSILHEIALVARAESLAPVVVGDEIADVLRRGFLDGILDRSDGDGVDARRGFSEQQIVGSGGEATRSRAATALTGRKRSRGILREARESETFHE